MVDLDRVRLPERGQTPDGPPVRPRDGAAANGALQEELESQRLVGPREEVRRPRVLASPAARGALVDVRVTRVLVLDLVASRATTLRVTARRWARAVRGTVRAAAAAVIRSRPRRLSGAPGARASPGSHAGKRLSCLISCVLLTEARRDVLERGAP